MLKKENTIIVIPPAGTYPKKLYDAISAKGYAVFPSMQGGRNVIYRFIRSYSMKYNLRIQKCVYGDWKNVDLKKIEVILFFHDKYSYLLIKYLRRKLLYKGKIYLYYMDPIRTSGAIDCRKIDIKAEILSNDIDVFSFEKRDCEEYGFKFNTLFFFKEDIKGCLKHETDVFFIGTDKNRLQALLKIKEILDELGIKSDIHICKYNGRASKYGKSIGYKYSKYISYEQLLEKVLSTKCVLDIVPENQEEVTLRVYEALFYKKKIITNNSNVKQYAFYSPHNIFIWGVDNISGLKDFIYGKFDESLQKEIDELDFDKWLRRF